MNFLKEFFTHPRQTGAVAASSNRLAELITETANVKNKKCVVELGSGTGIFTQKIYEKKGVGTLFFALEINADFCKETIKNCPNAIVYNDSVENIQKYLLQYNRKNCDCIISGLPWAGFDTKLQNTLLDSIYDSLDEGGIFLTFAYIHGLLLPSGKHFNALLKNKFTTVKKTKIIWLNLPPAFVYVCEKN